MTIKDIAKLSGVGVSTVSRVLNDRPDVSEESRRRVLEVIAEHNYLPNNSARSLVRTIRSDAVGLVVRGVQNPFYTDIIRAIEHKLDLAGYTMVMRQIASGDDEVKCGAVMEREKRLQGLIFLGGRSDYSPAELALLNVPFVCCTYTNAYGTLDPSKYSSVSIAMRSFCSARRSSRDTCTCDTPSTRAVCSCVSALKKRSRIVMRSRSGSRSIAARRESCSIRLSSGLSVPRSVSSVRPSPISC